MEIVKLEKNENFYHKYPQQTRPQPTYVELECEALDGAGRLSVIIDAEIGGAVPMTVWHNRVLRWAINAEYAVGSAVNELLDSIAPLAERVVAGYECIWDGNNNVGQLNEDAIDASDEISRISDDWMPSDDEAVYVVDATEYFDGDSELTTMVRQGSDDVEIEARMDEIIKEDDTFRHIILEHVGEFIEDLREETK
jgi:hypothetical protein